MNETRVTEAAPKTHAWLKKYCAHKLGAADIQLSANSAEQAWDEAAALLGLNEFSLAEQIADEFGLSLAKLSTQEHSRLVECIPLRVAKRFGIFPLELSAEKIIVATSQPVDQDMLSMVGFLIALHVEPRIASPAVINQWIEAHYPQETGASELVVKRQEKHSARHDQEAMSNDSAIIGIVSDMLLEAFELNASDIHIEPFKDGGVIRYRVDGMLRVITELPNAILLPILQRIKAISGLNLANKLIPQDGSVSLVMRDQPVDLRISTIPVKGGEKAVIRLLIQSSVGSLDDIGLPEQELQQFKHLLSNSSGIFVITGPTGSGKSTTLYTALKELNTHDRCLVTVEDPIEYDIDGIAQISINPTQHVTFNAALRSILRQDPDVILVGEVRDEETAEITFRAAMTGHFVMTTLHTNDAVTTISRLEGLGIPKPILADSLRGVAAQRLVRKLCQTCASTKTEDQDQYSQRLNALLPDISSKSAKGCQACNDSGYRGRMPLFEIITIDNTLADAIREGRDASELRHLAKMQNNRPMSLIALESIKRGETSAAEVHRVLGEQFWQDCQNI